MFQTLKYFPARVLFVDGEVLGVLLFGVAGVLWLLVPFLDRSSSRSQPRKLVTYLGIGVIAYIVVLTILGWMA